MNIQELEEMIIEQTRNGRDTIYVPVSILDELGASYEQTQEQKVFIDEKKLEDLVDKYKKEHNYI
jgi:hypothetical protein